MTRKDAIENLRILLNSVEDKEAEETFKMAIKSLEVDEEYCLAYEDAKAAGPWIDIHDKLPEKGKNDFVLCCFRNGYVDACTRGYLQENDNIVAWMPLPEPYKGAE